MEEIQKQLGVTATETSPAQTSKILQTLHF